MLQQLAQGMATCLMDKSDAAKPMMRSAARELLASCVLRPIVHLFTPYNIHKVLHSAPALRCACVCRALLSAWQTGLVHMPLSVPFCLLACGLDCVASRSLMDCP